MRKYIPIFISLGEEEGKKVEELKKKGIKIVDIFRKGLETIEKKQ